MHIYVVPPTDETPYPDLALRTKGRITITHRFPDGIDDDFIYPITLTMEEIHTLQQAKEANPYWFNAVLHAGKIMIPRRVKYAGQSDPYWNFVDMAYRLGERIMNVFRMYLNIKVSRLTASQSDFEDESQMDTYADAANYALIALGWQLRDCEPDDVIKFDEWKAEQERINEAL
jgi:hypothetical protein